MTTELERIVMTTSPAMAEMTDAFRKATDHLRDFRAEFAVNVIADEYRAAHPGRRLPGGMSNRRLVKKRIDRLCRWWIEQES